MVDNSRPESIAELARDATQVREPGRALRSIARLRARLDDLEEFHVDNALEHGWSWAQVARALGVTRQAAHKRHARRLRTGAARERLTVTAAAQRVVARARREAAARGHRSVAGGHVLLALLDPESGRAADVLRELGVGAAEMEAELPPRPARRGRAPQISPEVHRAFEQSLAEALLAESDRLEPEHLLLALLRQASGAANRALGRAGVTAGDVQALLRRNVRSHA